MAYPNLTPWYGIPSVGVKQRRSAEEEQKAAQIVENQLLGLMRVRGDGIIY